MSAAKLWHVPTWAAQTMFDHDSGIAVRYSAECDPLAYATGTTYLSKEDVPEDPAVPPLLVLRVGDGDAVMFEPNSGAEVRELAQALLDCAHV